MEELSIFEINDRLFFLFLNDVIFSSGDTLFPGRETHRL